MSYSRLRKNVHNWVIMKINSSTERVFLGVLSSRAIPIHSLKQLLRLECLRLWNFLIYLLQNAGIKCEPRLHCHFLSGEHIKTTHMQIHYFKTILYSHEVSFWSDNRHNQVGFAVSVSNRKLCHPIQFFLDCILQWLSLSRCALYV